MFGYWVMSFKTRSRLVNEIEYLNAVPTREGKPFRQFLFDQMPQFRQELGKTFAGAGYDADRFEARLENNRIEDNVGNGYSGLKFLVEGKAPQEPLAQWKSIISHHRDILFPPIPPVVELSTSTTERRDSDESVTTTTQSSGSGGSPSQTNSTISHRSPDKVNENTSPTQVSLSSEESKEDEEEHSRNSPPQSEGFFSQVMSWIRPSNSVTPYRVRDGNNEAQPLLPRRPVKEKQD